MADNLSLGRWSRYWHTLRYLKPEQFTGRLRRRLRRLDVQPPAALQWRPPAAWCKEPLWRTAGWLGGDRFRLLGTERELPADRPWNDPQATRLWLYNLHYFEWLDTRDVDERLDEAAGLRWMQRWIAQNPAPAGVGWEPYVLSLRWINWARWFCARGKAPPRDIVDSLVLQAHLLSQQMETHLLGNHLFENAKTLLFAGCLMRGAEADRWWTQGARWMDRELGEQILADGACFELSPMYHAIVMAGLLDLLALQAAVPDRPWATAGLSAERLCGLVVSMRRWLELLTHPDGDIAFFNDSAFDNAPRLADLDEFVRRLGLPPPEAVPDERLTLMRSSGFARADRNGLSLIARLGQIGPDYLPGHAHADSLSFEMSLDGQRVFVNSGTSTYEAGPERMRQRGTPAHNTVCVDDADSSEVWGGFRVARRARPLEMNVGRRGDWVIAAAHDGYRRLGGRVVHHREWRCRPSQLVIQDRLSGRFRSAVARYHLHPAVQVEPAGPDGGRLRLPGGQDVTYRVARGAARIEDSTWHPRFGESIPNRCLAIEFAGDSCAVEISYR